MAWIESHQELARHPKTRRLARLLGTSVPAAIGHLQLLWWWAMDYAPDGNLSAFDETEIADAMMWEGDPNILVEALVASRFLDTLPDSDGYLIHDWDDYAGRLIDKRQANAERMREARAKHVQRTSGARAGATVPNRTVPDLTLPDTPPPTPYPASGEGDAADAAGKKRRGRRNGIVHDESAAQPLQEPELAPVNDQDRSVWNLARANAAKSLSNGNAEALGLLEPIGRAADGGLHLRAPPGLGLAKFTNHVARALLDAGDQAASRVAIVEGRPGESKG